MDLYEGNGGTQTLVCSNRISGPRTIVLCGTEQHTRTNYSYRINGGSCQDAWPYGNTLSEFVNIYR